MKKKISLYFKLSSILAVISILIAIYLVYDIGDKVERYLYGVEPGVIFEGQDLTGYLRCEVEELVLQRAEEERIEPQNAYIDRDSGEIILEVIGKEVNVLRTVNVIMEANEKSKVSLVIIHLDPEITQELLSSIDKVIGSYFTWHGSGYSRVTNIRMGTYYINNTLLHPGEVFSFNKTVGPVTAERGFQYAPVIVSRSVTLGLGGGLCQVSSTLYNAVLEADLQIVERYPHSRPVGYVPQGRDATVSYSLDFKFQNNSNSFILIKGGLWGGRVQIELYSNQSDEEDY